MNSYIFEEIEVGKQIEFLYNIDEEKMLKFKEITGDINPLHNNLEYAKKNGYKEKVVYGMLTASILSTLAGVYMPGKYSLIRKVDISFAKPVFLSDTPLKVKAKVIEKEERFKIIKLKYDIINQKLEKVLRGTMEIGFVDNKKEEI